MERRNARARRQLGRLPGTYIRSHPDRPANRTLSPCRTCASASRHLPCSRGRRLSPPAPRPYGSGSEKPLICTPFSNRPRRCRVSPAVRRRPPRPPPHRGCGPPHCSFGWAMMKSHPYFGSSRNSETHCKNPGFPGPDICPFHGKPSTFARHLTLRTEDRVDHMDNPVRRSNVGLNYPGIIDFHAVSPIDRQLTTLDRFRHSLLADEGSRTHFSRNDVKS